MRAEERNLYTNSVSTHAGGISEKVSDQSSCNFPFQSRCARYGAWHTLNQVTVASAIKVAAATIAQIMFATDGINRIYWRRHASRITKARSAVPTIDRKPQLLRCDSIGSWRDFLRLEILR